MADSPDEHRKQIRRTYGRGYSDALKAVGIENPGVFVNLNKLRAKEQGLNGQAKKVYDVLQIQTSMTVQEVMQTMHGKGLSPEHRVVQGCLGELVDQGLARSPVQGRYQRVAPTPVAVPTQPRPDNISKEIDASTPVSTIDEVKRKLIAASDHIAEAVGLLDTLEAEQAKKLEAAQKVSDLLGALDEFRRK